MSADGELVIAWESDGQDGSNLGIYAQRYTLSAGATGVTAEGSEFKVNSETSGQQSSPSAAMDADGDFIIAWESYGQDGSNFGVYGRRYNSSGVAQDSEFQVNTYTTAGQFSAAAAMESNGDFVIVWESNGQDSGTNGVYGQGFTVPLGSEFHVNTYTTGKQSNAVTAMDADGDFVVVWVSNGQDGSGTGIYAQRYNSSGAPVGIEFRVNTYTTGNQHNPAVAMEDNGDFAIAWESFDQDTALSYGIYARYGIYAQRFG
jgi:hypothetical protein